MSKQKAPPVCCNQPAEFVVNGNSDSLQYYYCRVCKQEPKLKDGWSEVKVHRSGVVYLPPGLSINIPGVVAVSSCPAVRSHQAHNFTAGRTSCVDCGLNLKAPWDGEHQMVGHFINPASVHCLICNVAWDSHVLNGRRRCTGRPPVPPPPTGVAGNGTPIVSKPHVWLAVRKVCVDCGIALSDYNNHGTSCDDYKKARANGMVP